MAEKAEDSKIPVTIITGFLGSGKTTLLDFILHNDTHKKRIAVIENEYATPIGVDNEMKTDINKAVFVAEIMETTSGCLCCAGKGNFLNILNQLIEHRSRFDYIIIETDGLSDPTFAKAFFQEPLLEKHLVLDGIVTLVDCKHIMEQLDKPKTNSTLNEALEQIAVADRIILNKLDLVSKEALDIVRRRVTSINPVAEIMQTEYSKVDINHVLDIKAFALDRVQKQDPGFLEHRPERKHDAEIGSLSFVTQQPISVPSFKKWMDAALQRQNILRLKGVLVVQGTDNKYTFQGVNRLYTVSEHKPWAAGQPRFSRLVFIGRSLNKEDLLSSFEREVGPKVSEEKPRPPSSAPNPLGLLFLFAVTMLTFAPDEVSRTLSGLPYFPLTNKLVEYRWYFMAALVLAWVVAGRKPANPK